MTSQGPAGSVGYRGWTEIRQAVLVMRGSSQDDALATLLIASCFSPCDSTGLVPHPRQITNGGKKNGIQTFSLTRFNSRNWLL